MAMTNFGTNDPLAVNLRSSAPQAAIRAELIAEDSCSALGMTGRGLMTARGIPGTRGIPGCCSARGYSRCTQHGAPMGPNEVHMIRLAYPFPEAARIAGVGRTRNLRGRAQAGIDNKKGWSRKHRHTCILGRMQAMSAHELEG